MPISPELEQILKGFEKESGFGQFVGLGEGVYHFRVTEANIFEGKEDGLPSLQIKLEVLCGESQGSVHSDFLNVFGPEGGFKGQSEESSDKSVRDGAYKKLRSIVSAIGPEAPDTILTEFIPIAYATRHEGARVEQSLENIGEALVGCAFYGKLAVSKKAKEGAKPRLYAVDSDASEALCECKSGASF